MFCLARVNVMNSSDIQINTGRICLATAASRTGTQWLAATEQIRGLPGVRQVETNLQAHQVEIVFNGPAGSLLQRIHQVLQGAAVN
jgi:hypothetical protein